MKGNQNKIQIKALTWTKDSNELLDYESVDLVKTNLINSETSYLVRNNDDIKFINQINNLDNKVKPLFRLIKDNSDYQIEKIHKEGPLIQNINSADIPWIVTRNFKAADGSSGYRLTVGDIVKLGRVKLKIREIKYGNNNDECCSEGHSKIYATKINDKSAIDEKNQLNNNNVEMLDEEFDEKVLKICYCDEFEVDSPLIQPCMCSGTMKYIHFSCLQTWLKSKIIVKTSSNETNTSYALRQIECELCKNILPDYVKIRNRMYEIWDFTKPKFRSYLTFETLITEKNANRILYVVNLDSKSEIKIGRGHDSDVRISDISVSRNHANLKKDKEGFLVIEDNKAKFGTLIYMQPERMPILKHLTLSLQIGRSFFQISIKKPYSFFGCLCNSEKTSKKEKKISYQTLNSQFINIENCIVIKVQEETIIENNENDEILEKNSLHNESGLRVIDVDDEKADANNNNDNDSKRIETENLNDEMILNEMIERTNGINNIVLKKNSIQRIINNNNIRS